MWLVPALAYRPEMRMRYTLRVINTVNSIVITLQSLVQFVCPYFLPKILNFWKHSPSFFYWEVDRYETQPTPTALKHEYWVVCMVTSQNQAVIIHLLQVNSCNSLENHHSSVRDNQSYKGCKVPYWCRRLE